jgi:site-specific DNA recombinase
LAARTNSHQPVRCAIYTRQSVAHGGGDPALASCVLQREKCLDFVRAHERHGWRALDERFDDEGYSGATVERPGLERLIELIAERGVERLVVYRLDRLTRSLGDWVRISAMLQRQDVKLSIVAGALDADSGALARMQLNTLAVFAELEREMIGERLANARALRRANGHRTSGRVPLGYASDPRTRQLVIVEAEANVVRWFFAEAASGARTVELVTRANDLGFAMKSGRRGSWTGREVLRLLRNPAYAGRLSDGAPAVHTPIVSPEQFDWVQEIIAGRQTRPSTASGPVDGNIDPFILRGLLACGRCGRKMATGTGTRRTRRATTEVPRYYRCRTSSCRGGQIIAAEAERIAFEAVSAPPAYWPAAMSQRLREFAVVWKDLWPINRRRTLATHFAAMTWHWTPERLDVLLREPQ